MQLRIDPDGRLRCLYGEAIDLSCLGTLTIRRDGIIASNTMAQAVQPRRPFQELLLAGLTLAE